MLQTLSKFDQVRISLTTNDRISNKLLNKIRMSGVVPRLNNLEFIYFLGAICSNVGRAKTPTAPRKARPDDTLRAMPTRSFGPVLFFPLHPIPPLPSLRRIEFLATETRHELLRIGRVRETVDVEPLLVMTDAMAAQAQRQILAEVVDGLVAAVLAAGVGWAKARSAVPMRSFTEADQQVAATVGERRCVEKRSAFDLEPTIRGIRISRNGLVGTALRAFAHPTIAVVTF